MVWKVFDIRTYFPVEPSRSLAVKYFVTGIILPCICYLIAAGGRSVGIEKPWQSGQPNVYATLLLSRPVVFIFLPLKAFSMAGLAIWMFRPACRRELWVRLAVFGGVILSLQVLVITFIHSGPLTLIAAGIFGTTLAVTVFLFAKIITRQIQISIAKLLLLMTVVAVLIALTIQTEGAWLAYVLLSIPLSAPTLAFATYVRAAIGIGSEAYPIPSLLRLLVAVVTYVGAWLLSWRLAINVVLAEYQRLPTTDPNCYVSSAAAYGHSRLVRAAVYVGAYGQPIRVNRQMRLLKFLELTLLCFMPSLHRRIRHLYDRAGPILARGCRRSPLLADLAFVGLLPLQLTAELLRRVFRIPNAELEKFWQGRDATSSSLTKESTRQLLNRPSGTTDLP